FLSLPVYHPVLPSFPTRRSSDLVKVAPEEVLSVAAAPRNLSIGRLADVLRGATPAAASHAYYRTNLHHGFALLLTAPLMVLLSRSEEHTSELQSRENLVCRLLLE